MTLRALQTRMLKIQRSIFDESAENAAPAIRCGVCKVLLCQDGLEELHTQAPVFAPWTDTQSPRFVSPRYE